MHLRIAMMNVKIVLSLLSTIVFIGTCNCQDKFPEYTYQEENPFFESWRNYRPEPIRLDNREAAWWYSLGEYYNDGETYRPTPLYPQYEYPPSGGGGPSRCEFIPGPMRTRREFRELSLTEREAFHSAVLALANFCPSGCAGCPSAACRSAYGLFLEMHQSSDSPGAHGGASFLPFHREYLWRFENALIKQGGYPEEYALPYWDNILDSNMPDPTDSILWTGTYMGPEIGDIGAAGSPFAGITVPLATISPCDATVTRNAGSVGSNYLMQESDVDTLMNQTCFGHLYQNFAWGCPGGLCNFEGRHGSVHIWVGGDMGNLCSPSDPLFWLHHANIDCLWEDFRQNAQTTDLELEYPQTVTGGPQSDWNAEMRPFLGHINAHGLSTHYTRYYYTCSARPSGIPCQNDRTCHRYGTALWCDPSVERCRSQIRTGGNCFRNGANMPDNTCERCPALDEQAKCRDGICGCFKIYVIQSDTRPIGIHRPL